jgi:hypothetical protein
MKCIVMVHNSVTLRHFLAVCPPKTFYKNVIYKNLLNALGHFITELEPALNMPEYFMNITHWPVKYHTLKQYLAIGLATIMFGGVVNARQDF